jgi:hypothetical protein
MARDNGDGVGAWAPQLRRWVEAGLLDEDQAAAIDAFEAGQTDREHRPRISVAAEVLGYLGAILLVVGIASAIAASDLTLGTGGVLVLLGLGAVAFGAGFVVVDRDEPAGQRLASVLGFLSSGSSAAFVAVLLSKVVSADAATVALLTGAAALVPSLAFWMRCPLGLQQLAVLGAATTAVFGALDQVIGVTTTIAGVTLFVVGVLWLLGARVDLVRPPRVAYALGAVTTLVGAQYVCADSRVLGAALGAATAVVLLIWGARSREGMHIGTGSIGLLVFLPQLVDALTGTAGGAALGLVAAGLVVLVIAVRMTRTRTNGRAPRAA